MRFDDDRVETHALRNPLGFGAIGRAGHGITDRAKSGSERLASLRVGGDDEKISLHDPSRVRQSRAGDPESPFDLGANIGRAGELSKNPWFEGL